MSTRRNRILVLGDADAGKTTFLVQLHGRVKAGRGKLTSRAAPESLSAIEAGLQRLQQGLSIRHTAQGTDVTLVLRAVAHNGAAVDILVPDYAGEDLRRVVRERRVPDRWRDLGNSAGRWLLLIRLSRHASLPDVLTRPIGEIARAAHDDPPGDPTALPVDLWAVELLQALLYARRREMTTQSIPRLTLVLSCWDELSDVADLTPVDLARNRLALLDSYCRATFGLRYDVVGLSSQGRDLDEDTPAEDFLDQGPQEMGWMVTRNGEVDSDLTRLIDDR